MTQKHRVVILGGGFAGLNAAQKLARAPVDITLIDRRNFHLFQPLLYQVATGSLSPGEICAPLRGVLSKQKNALVLMCEAIDLDPDAKRIQLRDGDSLEYDSIIVATGSKTSYYGTVAWREYAPSLKTIEEATAIRRKILYAFERAERCAAETDVHDWLTFVIVGAGATGLELAGALAEIANETLKNDFRRINPKHARIILMEGGDRVLPAYPPDLSEKAERLVKRLGVEVTKGVMATAVDSAGVTFKRGALLLSTISSACTFGACPLGLSGCSFTSYTSWNSRIVCWFLSSGDSNISLSTAARASSPAPAMGTPRDNHATQVRAELPRATQSPVLFVNCLSPII